VFCFLFLFVCCQSDDVQAVVCAVPLERILLETDAPFMVRRTLYFVFSVFERFICSGSDAAQRQDVSLGPGDAHSAKS
jgi:Tat protein secretion system quality control protein TatD with DNase activity